MADADIQITPGTGIKIDTRTVGASTDEHRQVIVLGDPATAANVASVSAAGALEVDGSGVTQPVSGTVAVSNFPATQPVSGTVTATGPLTDVQLRATAVPVSVSGTVTASGPLTDAQLRASAVPVSASALPLPTGAATAAKQPALGTAGASSTDVLSVQGIASGTALPVSGTVTATAADKSASISIAANSTASGSVTGLIDSGTALVQLTGTWVGTVQVQVTVDGSTWVNITGSNVILNQATGAYMASGNLTATGVYQVDVTGASGIRVITTAYTSGTITGTVRVVPGAGMVAIEGVPLVAQSGTWTVGITGYPTAAASADSFATPTVTAVGSTALAYNGVTWDRQRSGTYTLNVDTSSARTATGNGTAAVNYAGHRNLIVWINVTAVSGTTPTCVFKLQWSPDNGTTWIDWDTTNLQTTSITGVTTATLRVGVNATTAANSGKADFLPRQIRLQWTIGGTTPSFTFASWYTFTG